MSEAGLDFIISSATDEYLDLCEKYVIGVIANAKINVTFDDKEKITVYRKGVITEIEGNTLEITLNNEEGIFVIVS